MANKTSKIMIDMQKVGRILSRAKRTNKKLSTVAKRQCQSILKTATKELFVAKASMLKDQKQIVAKKTALTASVKESLIGKQASLKESEQISKASIANKIRAKRIQASIDSIKTLSTAIHTLSNKIIAKKRSIMSKRKAVSTKRKRAMDMVDPSDKSKVTDRNQELDKGVDTSGQIKEPATASKRTLAKKLYTQASLLIKKANKTKRTKVKASLISQSNLLEKRADKIVASLTRKSTRTTKRVMSVNKALKIKAMKERIAKRNAVKKASKKIVKKASIPVFAKDEKVLTADGVVASVASQNGDNLIVTIAGKNRAILASTVKKVSSPTVEKKAKTMSIAEKIKQGLNVMKTSRKKTAIDEVPMAVVDNAPVETVEQVEQAVGDTVGTTETKAVNYVDGLGWTVNKTNNEVVNFGEDKEQAEAFVKTNAADKIINSADTATPGSQESTVKKLKGLTQKSKGYANTTKDEQVNPERSMIGKASLKDIMAKRKTSTTKTKQSPVDSATTSLPDGSVSAQQALKGLSQKGKGYTETTKDEKIDAQLSVYARKQQVLTSTNKKLAERLAVTEATLLIDKAIKVGTIAEEQRSDQTAVYAELYTNSQPEFKAFARLVDMVEAQPAPTHASRKVAKLKNSMANRTSVMVDATSLASAASLEEGTFFDD